MACFETLSGEPRPSLFRAPPLGLIPKDARRLPWDFKEQLRRHAVCKLYRPSSESVPRMAYYTPTGPSGPLQKSHLHALGPQPSCPSHRAKQSVPILVTISWRGVCPESVQPAQRCDGAACGGPKAPGPLWGQIDRRGSNAEGVRGKGCQTSQLARPAELPYPLPRPGDFAPRPPASCSSLLILCIRGSRNMLSAGWLHRARHHRALRITAIQRAH